MSTITSSLPITTLFSVFCFVFVVASIRINSKRRLPAGVKPLPQLSGLPWLGRFWGIPEVGTEAAWYFGALHQRYGPIYSWKVMGITHIFIEADKIARDLYVRRQKYSDRNELPSAVGIKGACEILPLSGFSEDLVRHKNFVHSIVRHGNLKAFYGWPAIENRRTLRRLLESPERWSEHMITHCARTVASIAWGDPEHGKKLLVVVPDLLKAISPAGPIPNKLTFLMHLPTFLSPWKKAEARRRQLCTDAFYEALDDVKQRVKQGTAEACWSTLWLDQGKATEAKIPDLDYHEAAYAIGSSSFVGIVTIGGPLHAFFTAMCHYPNWFFELQDEVDRVCGNRLPKFEDIPNLPKIRATIKELLRWRQSTPLGALHEAMEDDVYEGYHIPKGAWCHANQFLIGRDPIKFPKPEQFIPERWLDPAYPTYREPLTEFPNLRGDIAFGYGSRACPGVDLTNLELCTLIGALAWSFDIRPKEERVPWYEVNPFVITMSKHFPVDIQVRSQEKRRFIIDECPSQDPGYTLKDEKEDKWDIVKPSNGEPWDWEGLLVAFDSSAPPKVYPPGV